MTEITVVETETPEPLTGEAAPVEVVAEAEVAHAEAAVEVAAIEAEAEVAIAEINAGVAEVAIEAAAEAATSEDQYNECLMRISALETTTTEILETLSLIRAKLDPPQTDQQSAEESAVQTPDSQEAPEAPARRRPRQRWI
jgi:hypothetical protein